jgi:hypothetical protein
MISPLKFKKNQYVNIYAPHKFERFFDYIINGEFIKI